MTNQEKQWAMAWKNAAPKLQAIRDEELRQSRTKGFQYVDESTVVYDPAPHRNGLVKMQAWFMRFQLLQQRSDATPKRT